MLHKSRQHFQSEGNILFLLHILVYCVTAHCADLTTLSRSKSVSESTITEKGLSLVSMIMSHTWYCVSSEPRNYREGQRKRVILQNNTSKSPLVNLSMSYGCGLDVYS